MKRGVAILLVFALMVGVVVGGTACESCQRLAEGQLPSYNVGDTWTWFYVDPGTQTEFDMTETVTGEETVDSRDCYVIDMSFDPTMSWTYDTTTCTVTSMTYWGDKATALYGVKMVTAYTCNGTPYTMTETYSYDTWASLFPLEADKEVSMQMTIHSYSDGIEMPGSPSTVTSEYVVVGKEDITVAAGSFSCWKIDMYQDDVFAGSLWYSDAVRSMVKTVDATGATQMELISYSVQ